MPKNEEVSLASLGIQMPYSMQAEQRVLGPAPVDETVLAQTHQGQQQGWDHSQQHRHNGQSQSVQNAVYKVGGVLGQEGEIDEAGWECGIKHF